jgi:hypothetical protein
MARATSLSASPSGGTGLKTGVPPEAGGDADASLKTGVPPEAGGDADEAHVGRMPGEGDAGAVFGTPQSNLSASPSPRQCCWNMQETSHPNTSLSIGAMSAICPPRVLAPNLEALHPLEGAAGGGEAKAESGEGDAAIEARCLMRCEWIGSVMSCSLRPLTCPCGKGSPSSKQRL